MSREDTPRRWTAWPIWCLGGVLCLSGCHSIRPALVIEDARTQEASSSIVQAQFLPPPEEAKSGKPIPISLDTVLQLASDQNGQVRLLRMKVESAQTDQQWANKHWIPDISLGMGVYRHEGGIQDFQGNLVKSSYGSVLAGLEVTGTYDWKQLLLRRVEAERKVWQQKGELSKLNSETLLDATTTYVSMLSARTGVVISLETEIRLKDLLDKSIALAKVDPGLRVEVSRIEAELMAQTVLTVRLREASKASAAKLAYLLGLNPCCEFLVADGKLVPITLLDGKAPVKEYVDQTLARGPGVRELEGLLQVVQTARSTNYGFTHWMPAVDVGLVEGGFGAGPNSQLDWANRFDLGVHMKWNLSEFYYAKLKRQQADMSIQQVHISYQDLRAKLTLGVQEACDAIQSGREQIDLAEKHIRYAEESFRLSDIRLKENIKGRSSSEVLLALRSLGGARLEYLQAVRDYNKAQLRLYILVGAGEK